MGRKEGGLIYRRLHASFGLRLKRRSARRLEFHREASSKGGETARVKDARLRQAGREERADRFSRLRNALLWKKRKSQ